MIQFWVFRDLDHTDICLKFVQELEIWQEGDPWEDKGESPFAWCPCFHEWLIESGYGGDQGRVLCYKKKYLISRQRLHRASQTGSVGCS